MVPFLKRHFWILLAELLDHGRTVSYVRTSKSGMPSVECRHRWIAWLLACSVESRALDFHAAPVPSRDAMTFGTDADAQRHRRCDLRTC